MVLEQQMLHAACGFMSWNSGLQLQPAFKGVSQIPVATNWWTAG